MRILAGAVSSSIPNAIAVGPSIHLAFDGTDYAQLDKDLEGPTAIAFGIEDETALIASINSCVVILHSSILIFNN